MTTRIMVVDDEPAIGKLLHYQLTGFGYQVSYFQDGLQALERLLSERPDLVLLDVMMPLISGWEVCRQIRECSSVPIIMLTAKNADTDVVTGLTAGADDYVTKPFSMAQLHARIEAVLRRAAPAQTRSTIARPSARPDPHLTDLAELHRAPLAGPGTSVAEVTATSVTPSTDRQGRPLRLGQHIRETRMARGLTLHQVEQDCKIRWEFLQAIEQENWSYVPRQDLRQALRTYADYLGLNLPALIGRPRRPRPQTLFPLQFAAALALVLVLVVVGMYLL